MKNILLFTSVIATLFANAQGYYGFKNSDFETWTNATTITDWTLAGGSISKISHAQGWEAGGGASAAALKNEAASAGKLNMAFPFTVKVPFLMFDYKFQSASTSSSDTFEVDVKLTRWIAGARETVGRIIRRGNLSDGTWQTFSFPFTLTPGATPDSCFIAITSSINSGYNNATILNIDNFRFQAPAGVPAKVAPIASGVFPNPVKTDATFTYELKHDSKVIFTIIDVTGKVIETNTFNGKAGRNEEKINFERYKSGIYFYEIKTDNEVKSGKFTVSH